MPYGIFQELFALVLDSVPAEDGRAVGIGMSTSLLLSLLSVVSAMMNDDDDASPTYDGSLHSNDGVKI
jgi:hypothetical protein